ncbi:MAG: phenylacetate-CoA oxygenase subunit PaaJ [Actinobacteria bacterium]|nr:phenylacetate-CoA oxygenase subunit PaaJ [Actinomycetota bacterium]
MVIAATISIVSARKVAASVVDPEIPVLTIDDLGILRSVEINQGGVIVTITPTYSGCPAIGQIEDDIVTAFEKVGVEDVEVETVRFPAWSTDWISEDGHRKLSEFGTAPPVPEPDVLCPRCDASAPKLIARFGSTACKALMVCSSCGEPFDYFKQF